MRSKYSGWACLFFLFLGSALHAAEPLPDALKDIGIDPVLGQSIPLELGFQDEQGQTKMLSEFFDGTKPVVLVLSYYGCPMLCGIILNAARDAFAGLDWIAGNQYRVVTISIDPHEDFRLAAEKKKNIILSLPGEAVKRDALMANWHFMVGSQANIHAVASSVGFKYRWIPEEKQFAHGAAIFILSPKGKLSRVLFGSSYPAQNLKLALLEASAGKVGTIAEKILLFCYHYDPKENKYALFATRLMRLAGAITLAAILGMYMRMYIKQKNKRGIV